MYVPNWYLSAYMYTCRLVPRPIPSFSACNIEKLGTGLGTRLVHMYTKNPHLFEYSECLWVQDINVLILCPCHDAADSISLFVALLQCGHTGDDGLTLQGNVLEYRGKW